MLKAFYDRLCDLCADDDEGPGKPEGGQGENEAQQVRTLAHEFGLLKHPAFTLDELVDDDESGIFCGSEHIVEFSSGRERVGKMTLPGKFGFMPGIADIPVVNLRGEPGKRQAIEFFPAGPREYLCRCLDANAVFGDDVELASVVEWSNGRLSFGITQPQYAGEPASEREIEEFFRDGGWEFIKDSSGEHGHSLFFNYAWGILAIDALPRNCFVNEGKLLPFDVILCRPDAAMEDFLSLYPG